MFITLRCSKDSYIEVFGPKGHVMQGFCAKMSPGFHYPKALRTQILRFSGPKTILYRAFGRYAALGVWFGECNYVSGGIQRLGTSLEALRIRTIVCWCLFLGPPIYGNFQPSQSCSSGFGECSYVFWGECDWKAYLEAPDTSFHQGLRPHNSEWMRFCWAGG